MKNIFLACCLLIFLFSCHAQAPNRNIAVKPDAIRASKMTPTSDSRESICNPGEQEFEIRFVTTQHRIYSFNFLVMYNADAFEFRSSGKGDFLGIPEKDNRTITEGNGNGRVIFFAHPEKDGVIQIGLSLLGKVPGKKGEGRLATLCFAIKEPQKSSEFRIRDIRLTKSLTSSLLYSSVVQKGGGISFLSRRISAPQLSEGLLFS